MSIATMTCPTDDFRANHEAIMARWDYPSVVKTELRDAREKWIRANMESACCKAGQVQP